MPPNPQAGESDVVHMLLEVLVNDQRAYMDVCLTISDDPGQDVWLEIREAPDRPTCYKTIERYRGHAQHIKCAVRHRQKGSPTVHVYLPPHDTILGYRNPIPCPMLYFCQMTMP